MKLLRKKQQRWYSLNKLANITEREIIAILDASSTGYIAREQALYHELEKVFPVYNMLKQRRLSALKSRDIDGKEAFYKLYEAQVRDLIKHLGDYVFYGIAVAKPVMIGNVWIDTIFMDSRDLRINYTTAEILWSHIVDGKIVEEVLDQNETCIMMTDAPMCYSIAQMFARYVVILDKYCDYMERFGIPNVSVVMPTGGNKEAYQESANAAQEGENVIWPANTIVNFAPVDKSTAPFIEFLEYVDKEIVKLCTGGVLTTLAEATGMGSGVANSQDNTWAEVTVNDAIDIAAEISRVFNVKFTIDRDITTDSGTAIEQIATLEQAGFNLDEDEVSKATGWKVKRT